jgi:hypothetical protein
MWKTMLGVMEADCLQPSHTKQEFDISSHLYKKVTDHLRSTMKFYYENIQTVTTGWWRMQGKMRAQALDRAVGVQDRRVGSPPAAFVRAPCSVRMMRSERKGSSKSDLRIDISIV